uniref:EF-hand domain-containing protein n=1 Tax=Caenorhabditis tropicalis TaxID=1561998 RepID=A0A1I7TTI8_9PELO
MKSNSLDINQGNMIPYINMSLISRRSDESLKDFERSFNARVMDIFADNRLTTVEELKKDTEDFLKSVKMEFIWGESGKTKYVTLTRLTKILKKSPKSIRDLLPHKTVSTFVKITNFNLTIDITLLEELVNTVVYAEELYIKLLPFSENSTEISNYSLQDFVASHYVPKMIEEPERSDYYSAYAVGIIFFLLDTRKREYIFLKDLLSSTLLMQLEACINAENNCLPMPEIDVFTVAQFRSTLHEFRLLDTDRNGVLSRTELTDFREGNFNGMFLQRVFDISMTYENGCLDFKAFVDLVTAIRFRHTQASAKYHFEALDLKHDGILDEEEIRTAVCFQAQVIPEYVSDDTNVNIDIVTAELKDMLHLKKSGLTSEDFVADRMNPTFSGFLSNYADYIKYERREQ